MKLATFLLALLFVGSCSTMADANEAETRELAKKLTKQQKKALRKQKKNKKKNKKNKKNKYYPPPTWPVVTTKAPPTWPVVTTKPTEKVEWPNWWPKPTNKPTPKPTKKPTPKPTPKPTMKKEWMSPCGKLYEFQFPDSVGSSFDINLAVDNMMPPNPILIGDITIFSGDLWKKGNQFKVGFLNQLNTIMATINGDTVVQTVGTMTIGSFGDVTFGGFLRDKYDGNIGDDTGDLGPLVIFPITGGTKLFEGAGGEITCRRIRTAEAPNPDFDLLITATPKCRTWPAPPSHGWP